MREKLGVGDFCLSDQRGRSEGENGCVENALTISLTKWRLGQVGEPAGNEVRDPEETPKKRDGGEQARGACRDLRYWAVAPGQ